MKRGKSCVDEKMTELRRRLWVSCSNCLLEMEAYSTFPKFQVYIRA